MFGDNHRNFPRGQKVNKISERRTYEKLNSHDDESLGTIVTKGVVTPGGGIGRGPLGCLVCRSSQVSLVLGAKPEEVRTWHAFLHRLSLSSAMDVRTFLSLSLHWMCRVLEVDW